MNLRGEKCNRISLRALDQDEADGSINISRLRRDTFPPLDRGARTLLDAKFIQHLAKPCPALFGNRY